MKKIIVAIAVVMMAAGGWYYASPLWTLKAMRDAAAAKDSAALSAYVDYEALRTDLKGDMRRSMINEMGKQPENPFGAIGMAIAMNLIDPMIEAMVTPEGVEALFAGQRSADGAENAASGTASDGSAGRKAAGAARGGRAEKHAPGSGPSARPSLASAGPGDNPEIDRISIDEFRVRGGGKDGELIFRRHGLGWKLAGVDLPAV